MKKLTTKNSKQIYIAVYNQTINVVDRSIAFENFGEDINEGYGVVFNHGCKMCVYIDKESVDDDFVVPHECYHLSCEVLKSRNIPINYENQETLAYLLGFLTREVRKCLKELYS